MYADLTDVRCYYELEGQGQDVVLVPGLGATNRSWYPLVEKLSDRFCLVTPDNRGVGRSVEKRPAHSLRDYCADLIELFDHLQIDRAHLIGISMEA